MPRDGSGTFVPVANSWSPATGGTTISSSDWAAQLSDYASAWTTSIATDGQSTCSASIPFANGLTSSMPVGIGMIPVNVLDVTQNQNNTSIIKILNSSVGTGAQAYFQAANGTSIAYFYLNGTGFTPSGIDLADGAVLKASGAGGLTIGTSASQPLYFMTANSVAGRFDAGGRFLVAATAAISTENMLVKQSSGAATMCARFHNNDTSGNNQFMEFGTEAAFTARGSITYNRGAGLIAYNTASDYRVKDIVGNFTDSGKLIDGIAVRYGKMHGAAMSRPMFVAHEVAEGGMPWAVTGEKDAVNDKGAPIIQQLNESAMMATLWAEVKSLRARLAKLEAA